MPGLGGLQTLLPWALLLGRGRLDGKQTLGCGQPVPTPDLCCTKDSPEIKGQKMFI